MATVGFWLIVVGYVLAISGAALLYLNAPKDAGVGTIPSFSSLDEMQAHFQRQPQEIASRETWSRRGFGFLMLGSLCQLIGVIL